MATITTETRLRCASKVEAEAWIAWLRARLGAAVALKLQAGRNGVWFVRGTLTADPYMPQQLIQVVVPATGQVLQVLNPLAEQPPPMDEATARRLARLRSIGAPETMTDGADRHEMHKRLREQHQEEEDE